jgi:hypothetical protein
MRIVDRLPIVKLKIRPTDLCGVFRGSEAVANGVLTAEQLRGAQFRRLYRDVYLPAGMPVTHPARCEGIALVLPPTAVITGRSAATLRGIPLARATDPVEVVVPLDTRIARRTGLDVRRSDLTADEMVPWSGIGLATPLRMSLDLLLDRPLPDAVADLDAVLRAGLVDLDAVQRLVSARSDRGIVAARRAVELADHVAWRMALDQRRPRASEPATGCWLGCRVRHRRATPQPHRRHRLRPRRPDRSLKRRKTPTWRHIGVKGPGKRPVCLHVGI